MVPKGLIIDGVFNRQMGETMKAIVVAIMAASVAMAGQVQADEALAKAKNCMSCHAIDKKIVGPAYKGSAFEGSNPSPPPKFSCRETLW